MPSLIIQGYKFNVPDERVARYTPGYSLTTEGEAHALRQTLLENLRNNFAVKVKSELNGAESLSDEQVTKLQTDFEAYADKYEFGIRTAGEPRQKLDPLTREMLTLAKEDFRKAYVAKFNEKPGKDLIEERAVELMEKRRDDYMKRARVILRAKESGGEDTLASIGL